MDQKAQREAENTCTQTESDTPVSLALLGIKHGLNGTKLTLDRARCLFVVATLNLREYSRTERC